MIREVREEEVEQCAQLIRESFATVADAFGFTVENAPRFTAFATTGEGLWRHLVEEHRPMFAFWLDDTLAGYYALALQADGQCELNHLCVKPACRHQAIGAALVQHAFEKARELGCHRMNIGIVEENQVLRRWYESFGFVHTGTKKFAHFPFTCGFLMKELQ